jgi:cardiolipin synthase A/B
MGADVGSFAVDRGGAALMPQFNDGHQIRLLQGSEQYFNELEKAMDAALLEVRLETYIFDFTASSQRVAQSLIRAASRGVRVHLLVDGVGTEHLPADWIQRFNAAGVQWHVYNPLGKLGLLIPSRWRRLHRKLCVIDGGASEAVGFCGGINILDDHHDPNHGALDLPRFDFAVRVQGPLVQDILSATQSLWLRQRVYRQLKQRELQAALESWNRSFELKKAAQTQPLSAISFANGKAKLSRAALLLRDNVRNRKSIEKAYLKAIGEARGEIIIANAYFLPGGKLRNALLNAAKRGVKVKLLLQGRYEYFMQYHAARPVYEVLLQEGIEIHEYAVSFLHAKVAVVDADSPRAWATVGSSNLDPLSLLLAREANVAVQDTEFAQGLRAQLVLGMAQGGQPVSLEEFVNRPVLQRLLDRVAFGLMRFALSITGRRY